VEKDVDGILGISGSLQPVTPNAVKSILNHYNIEMKGKSILIIGNGPLVGLPLS